MSIHQIVSGVPYDSNIFLLRGSSNVLIDTGTGIAFQVVSDRIRSLIGDDRLDVVLLTHCHVDHIGGLARIIEEFGSTAYALPPDSDSIRTADSTFTLDLHFGLSLDSVDVVDLHPGEIIDIEQHRLKVIPAPGHTSGGACFLDEVTGSLFSGDTVFLDGIGRTDFPSGSLSQLRSSLQSLGNIEINGLYPGHGGCTDTGGSVCIRRGLRMVGEGN